MLPSAGSVCVDVLFQKQSISGCPVEFDMEAVSKMGPLLSYQKLQQDILFFQTKLAAVDQKGVSAAPAARKMGRRTCDACKQRQVCALLLPCRHYRYCESCASGFVVLKTPCSVCKEIPQGYLVVNNNPGGKK
jgi:hypothetical protein